MLPSHYSALFVLRVLLGFSGFFSSTWAAGFSSSKLLKWAPQRRQIIPSAVPIRYWFSCVQFDMLASFFVIKNAGNPGAAVERGYLFLSKKWTTFIIVPNPCWDMVVIHGAKMLLSAVITQNDLVNVLLSKLVIICRVICAFIANSRHCKFPPLCSRCSLATSHRVLLHKKPLQKTRHDLLPHISTSYICRHLFLLA